MVLWRPTLWLILKKIGALGKLGKFCDWFKKSVVLKQTAAIADYSLHHVRNMMPLVFRKMFCQTTHFFVYRWQKANDSELLECRKWGWKVCLVCVSWLANCDWRHAMCDGIYAVFLSDQQQQVCRFFIVVCFSLSVFPLCINLIEGCSVHVLASCSLMETELAQK